MKHAKYEKSLFLGLTDDLIREILLRMPAKSLGRVSCVCKKLKSLISDPAFAISHIKCSYSPPNTPLTIAMLRDNTLSSLKFSSYADITEGVKLKPWGRQFDRDDTFEGCYFFMIGSCNGLVCLYIKAMDKKIYDGDFMYLWNPITNEAREISLPVGGISTYVYVDSCWFGFVHSLNDYKILLVSEKYKPYREKYMYLYSLRNDSWRRIRVSDDDLSSISGCNSVFKDDALHYLVQEKCILKFDLATEAFERIPFTIVPKLFPSVNQMLLGVNRESDRLFVAFVHYSYDEFQEGSEEDSEEDSEETSDSDTEVEIEEGKWMLELWMLKEYNNWGSWKIMYRIDLQEEIAGRCIRVLGFTYNGIICIQAANHGFVVVDPHCDLPSYVVVRNSCSKVYKINDYVESSVSPFSPFPFNGEDEDNDGDDEEEDEEDDGGNNGEGVDEEEDEEDGGDGDDNDDGVDEEEEEYEEDGGDSDDDNDDGVDEKEDEEDGGDSDDGVDEEEDEEDGGDSDDDDNDDGIDEEEDEEYGGDSDGSSGQW
ncbi:F-box protein At3g07870-like [Chenopodium quinoa]|uniref:F-box protein At3g07870-like n=1 Tax=Chenopodium quinoa TaxID=63459 RepID=UPI000B77A88C|nr:F-box protein At3g07870-like [Chenopodium quinoa]